MRLNLPELDNISKDETMKHDVAVREKCIRCIAKFGPIRLNSKVHEVRESTHLEIYFCESTKITYSVVIYMFNQ